MLKCGRALGVAALVLAPTGATAQTRWQIDAGVGGGSVPAIGSAIGNAFLHAFSVGTYRSGPARSEGALGVRVVRVRDRHGFGVSYTREVVRNQVWLEDADPTPDGEQEITVRSAMLESFVYWDGGGPVRASSGIALGPALVTDRLTIEGDAEEAEEVFFAFQVDVITLSIGGRFRGWTSLGFGYRGLVAVGVTFSP